MVGSLRKVSGIEDTDNGLGYVALSQIWCGGHLADELLNTCESCVDCLESVFLGQLSSIRVRVKSSLVRGLG